ncbi:MAG TPA: serine hydrolase [Sandaracinaceae bacterium LLY-WYZ-13_1]|nr:serine hydrolase [Sandaracinaceae bacterium LLY-WYZ-13_1]
MRLVSSMIALVLLAGCDSQDSSFDGGGLHDANANDAAALDAGENGDAGGDALRARVEPAVAPLVDASGEDATRAVALVVVVVTAEQSSVFGFGALRAGGDAVPDGRTVFPVGSISKIYTGLMLAAAIESSGGVLAPETPVNALLAADLRAPSYMGIDITVEHLVTHYGALPTLPSNVTGPMTSPARDYSRAQLATFLSGHALDHAPGTTYEYSNLGSGLLGVALADHAGDAGYDALLRRALVEPLGMVDTGTNEPDFRARVGHRTVQPYRVVGDALEEVAISDMGVLAGGGEVLTTGDDLARFVRVLTGLDGFGVAGAVERTITPVAAGAGSTEVAYAIDVTTRPDGVRVYEKTGGTAGSTSFMSFLREPAVGVAILSSRGTHRAIRAVTRQLLRSIEEG